MTGLRPLDGLRVLDLSRAVAGPFAGRILADLGADVVKAELPGTDVAQAYGKVIRGRAGLYAQVNAGKRSILLDLHEPAGVSRLLDLAAACDVVVENFRPGILDRFGAGWPVLSAVNPRLVMLSISGFGQDGQDAGRAAYAPVIHAEAGLIGRQADLSGDPPADIAFALADTLAGLHGTIAILAALRLRDRTGTGQHIDISMLEAMLATDDYTHYSVDDHPIWPARGEAWPAPGGPILIASDRRHLWRQLATCFGLSDPDPDAALADKLQARAKIIGEWIAGHDDRDGLKRELETARLAWAEIRHAGDVLASPAIGGRGTIVEVTDTDGGQRSVVRMPYRFSDAASGPARGVPETGEDTADVLAEWTGRTELPARAGLERRPDETFAVLGALISGEVLVSSGQPEDLSSRGLKVEVRIRHFEYRDAEGDNPLPHFFDVVTLQLQVDRLQKAALIQGDAFVLVEKRDIEAVSHADVVFLVTLPRNRAT